MQNLLKVLNQKQKLCLDKRWKYVNFRGQTMIVRDFFEKMSYYVKKFVEVVDVAVQYDPEHAALPWAEVRFLLQLVINATDLQAIMAESLEKVSEMITRYAIVESMFLNTSSAIRAPLEAQISNLYFAILECIIKMSRYFGQSTTEALLKNPFKNFEKEMFPYISGITRRDDEIQALLQLHHHEGGYLPKRILRADASQTRRSFSQQARRRPQASRVWLNPLEACTSIFHVSSPWLVSKAFRIRRPVKGSLNPSSRSMMTSEDLYSACLSKLIKWRID